MYIYSSLFQWKIQLNGKKTQHRKIEHLIHSFSIKDSLSDQKTPKECTFVQVVFEEKEEMKSPKKKKKNSPKFLIYFVLFTYSFSYSLNTKEI